MRCVSSVKAWPARGLAGYDPAFDIFESRIRMPRLAAFVLSLCLLPQVYAADRPLTAVLTSDFTPWIVVHGPASASGPYPELLRELARRVKQPLVLLPCPITRCLLEMEEGRADLVIAVQKTPGRSLIVDFLDPPFSAPARSGLFVRSTDPRPFLRYEELYGKRVATTYNTRYSPAFDKDGRIQRDVGPNIEGSFNKLMSGRVDVVIANLVHGEEVAARAAYKGQVVRRPLVLAGSAPRQIGLARSSPYYSLKPQLQEALAGMVSDGTVSRLLARVDD